MYSAYDGGFWGEKNALRNKEYQKVFRAIIKTQDITSLNNFTQ